jgi:molecular chaperone GrpE
MTQSSPQNESQDNIELEEGVVTTEELLDIPQTDLAVELTPEAFQNLQDSLAATQEREKAAQDKYLRLHAEFENYRRRTAREQLELIETANGKLLERLSEVQDNFERAFAEENKTGNAEAFEKGMQLIHELFRRVLNEFGLEQIDPIGQEFDPNTHEAFLKQPSEQVPEGHVIQVFQKGYKIKNKLLKTAKVVVSAGKN